LQVQFLASHLIVEDGDVWRRTAFQMTVAVTHFEASVCLSLIYQIGVEQRVLRVATHR
jgi:hypothetical protein